jgi:four helix bundle protein
MSSDEEFLQLLIVARGSLSELETQFVIARRLGSLDSFEPIADRIDKIFGLLGGVIRSVKERYRSS